MRLEKEEAAGKSSLSPRRSRADHEAVFRWVRGAVTFAMNFAHGTLKKSTLAEMMGGGGGGRGLAGLDGAAQAGMIRAELGKIRQRRRSIIVARCAIPSLPCGCKSTCCMGWRQNREWGEAVEDLTSYVLEEGLAGTISHQRLRRAMVARYFLGKKSDTAGKIHLIDIAAQCGVHRNTVSVHNKAIVEHLKHEEQLATYEIEALLKEAGIIE